jgi:hypothetical protein
MEIEDDRKRDLRALAPKDEGLHSVFERYCETGASHSIVRLMLLELFDECPVLLGSQG